MNLMYYKKIVIIYFIPFAINIGHRSRKAKVLSTDPILSS